MKELFRTHLPGNFFHYSRQFFYIITDIDGFCQYANPYFLEQSEFAETDIPGFPFSAFLQPGKHNQFKSIIENVIANPTTPISSKLDHRFAKKTSVEINWEFHLSNDISGEGPFIHCAGIPVANIELNMEKKSSTEQLLRSELFYRNLIADSIDGILLTDTGGVISFAAPSVEKILGYRVEDIIRTNAFDYVHPDDLKLALSTFQDEVKMEPEVKYIDVRLRSKYGQWVYCKVRGHNLLYNPHIGRMAIYFFDDSRTRQAEEKLVESEQKFRQLISNLSTGVLLQTPSSEVVVCNKAAYTLLGLTADQMTGINLLEVNWDAINDKGEPIPIGAFPIHTVVATKQPLRDAIMGICRYGTNTRVWLLINAEPVFGEDGNVAYVICSFTDISEQKRLSAELIKSEIQKQRQVTQATIDGQEKERREIGKELHDNIGQHLTTTRLYLEVVQEKATGEIKEIISHAHKELSDIILEIRRLSQSLVPPTLGDIGLVASIEDICGSLKRANDSTIDFNHCSFQEQGIPENMKLMLFRIIQEQLNNIVRHASASRVQINLRSTEAELILEISDNGKGFDTAAIGNEGLGLTNMINRAALFNGRTEISSAPGEGCTVLVSLPLK